MGSPKFHAILEELGRIHDAKDADYSGGEPLSNFREAESVGVEPWRGVLVRMKDKWKRIESFAMNGKLENEGFRDALMDMAAYSVIAVCCLPGEQCRCSICKDPETYCACDDGFHLK